MNISICICTFNRALSLKETLESLVLCADEISFGDEILVVDNNSSDETKDVVSSFMKALPVNYLYEKEQGLANARNKALSMFKNDIIIFIDDDITVLKGFINAYKRAFLTYKSGQFFGGRIDVDWGRKQPYWYKSNDLPMLNGLLGNYNMGTEDKQYRQGVLLPYGANFALRKALTQKVGKFNSELGVKGEHLGRGEETDYFRRALDLDCNGHYIESARVRHRFQTERITLTYLYRYGLQKGTEAALLDDFYPNGIITKIIYQFCAGFYQLMKLRIDRFYQCVINIGALRGASIAAVPLKNSVSKQHLHK